MTWSGNEALANIRSLLSLVNGYTREAWRLQNQHKSQAKGERRLLPEKLMATPASVRRDFTRLGSLNTQLEGIEDRLIDAGRWLKEHAGAMSEWVEPAGSLAYLTDWNDLIDNQIQSVRAALKLNELPSGVDDKIYAGHVLDEFDWSIAGQAGVELDYAIRAWELISQAQENNDLQPGTRAIKLVNQRDSTSRGIGVLMYGVIDSKGNLLGESDHLLSAVNLAKQANLSLKQTHELTPDQLKHITTFVTVVPGRGKTGVAKTGPERLLTADSESLEKLRLFIASAYQLARQQGEVVVPSDPQEAARHKTAWINQSVSNLLRDSFDTSFKSMMLPRVGHLALVKASTGLSEDTILNAVLQEARQSAGIHEDSEEQEQAGTSRFRERSYS